MNEVKWLILIGAPESHFCIWIPHCWREQPPLLFRGFSTYYKRQRYTTDSWQYETTPQTVPRNKQTALWTALGFTWGQTARVADPGPLALLGNHSKWGSHLQPHRIILQFQSPPYHPGNQASHKGCNGGIYHELNALGAKVSQLLPNKARVRPMIHEFCLARLQPPSQTQRVAAAA